MINDWNNRTKVPRFYLVWETWIICVDKIIRLNEIKNLLQPEIANKQRFSVAVINDIFCYCLCLIHVDIYLIVHYFFNTGTFGQPEVDSVNSLAEKHQMTIFLPLIQSASLAALR